ncbi:MAG: hypothetical protein M3N97_10185 [Pseudomonadota bacterium]|nr:hypothetical protein [Pseudomonadota bacterium]
MNDRTDRFIAAARTHADMVEARLRDPTAPQAVRSAATRTLRQHAQ